LKSNKLIGILIIIGTAAIFFAMNVFTHKISDDFYWENISGTSQKVQSMGDIFQSIFGYYMATEGTSIKGGRVIAVFITQMFILIGKPFFNIANTFAYIVLILLMYYHIFGSIRKINWLFYGAINLFVWYFVPAWGENFLWLTGSCFSVWPIIIILFFLIPLRNKIVNPDYKLKLPLSILYFIPGLLAGISYENAAAGVFFALLAYFVIKIIRKEKIALFEIVGAAGFLIGFMILIAAPGNYSRLAGYEIVQQYGFFKRLIIRLFVTTHIFFSRNGALLTGLSVIFCLELLLYQKKKIFTFSYLYLLTGIVGAYSMILSPVFLERTFFPVPIFLIIGFLNLFRQIEWPQMFKRHLKIFAVIILLVFSASLLRAGVTIMRVYKGDENYNVSERHYGRSS
jgi:hypothetical protein